MTRVMTRKQIITLCECAILLALAIVLSYIKIFQLPFDGSINFERIASQIKDSDYKGSLMLEVIGTRPRYRAMDTETYISRAAEAAKHLRAMVEGENA